VSLALALAGALLLLRAGDGLTVRDTVADGVPITEVRPAPGRLNGPANSGTIGGGTANSGANSGTIGGGTANSGANSGTTNGGGTANSGANSGTTNGGGVVVAHGFAGSARLMRPFADTLARRGFVVVLFDFARHGRNTSTSGGDELDAAVRHLRSLPGVDPARISLVGHSMGAGAVTRYAASHPEIAATVAVSLGSLGSLDNVPSRILLIVGGLEFPGFQRVAAAASASGRHRVVTVPGVEHISVLFAPRTHEEVLRWLGAPPGPAPRPWLRLLAGGLLLIAFALGLYPLTALTLRPRHESADPPLSLLVAAPAGCAVAVGVGAVLPGLSVGGYVGVFSAVAGLAMLAWARLRGHAPALGKLSLPPFIFLGYAIISVAVPIHFGLTHALPTGPRWLLLPAMVAAFALLGLGTMALTGGRFRPTVAVFACAAAVLTGAAVLGAAPAFLLLIVPLLVLLLGWQAIWTATLTRTGAPPWVVAVACAVLPAWPTATAMPL
jgi:dienelactone hydrolase